MFYVVFLTSIEMNKIIYTLILIMISISCSQVKDISYFQNIEQIMTLPGSNGHDARIKPKDILSITVVSSEPAASRRYNLFTPQTETGGTFYSQAVLQNYLVDSDGKINFPSLGSLKVEGLNTKELELHINNLLAPFFTEEKPVVTVRIVNYSVNIMGEVLRPGKYESMSGRMTILDGLAMAGDMTIYGRRDNVKVLRDDGNGELIIYTVNLTDKNMFYSPAFFLEQNDVVYVEPNKSKANSSKYGAAESFRISTLSVLISLITMTTTIFGLLR